MKKIYLILIALLVFSCSSNDDAFIDPIVGRWSAGSDGVCDPSSIISFLQNNNFESIGSDYIDGECIEREDIYEYSSWQNKNKGTYNLTYKKIGDSEVSNDFTAVITNTNLELINSQNEVFKYTKL